jgi:hypothetical protein
MLPTAISGPNTISMCITSPNEDGLGTGVVFLGVFLRLANSPVSKTASAGSLSIKIVS